MTDQRDSAAGAPGQDPMAQGRVVVVGPDGMAIGEGSDQDRERPLVEMVEQPAKVMRIGSMIRQLLEEVRAAPAGRKGPGAAAADSRAVGEGTGVRPGPGAVEELDRLSLPFTEDEAPSEAELRIAQAQLVGWLEGLFHGIQTTLFAQQMAARAQLEQMRRALPPGAAARGQRRGRPAAPRVRPLPVAGDAGRSRDGSVSRPGRTSGGRARPPPGRTRHPRCPGGPGPRPPSWRG